MKISSILKIMGIYTLFSLLCGCKSSEQPFQSVSVTAFEQVIDDPNVIRLDVRTPEEYAEGHIAGTINIDVNNADFENLCLSQISEGKTIALYCRSGKRSKRAAEILSKQKYKIIELENGYLGWCKAGKAVAK